MAIFALGDDLRFPDPERAHHSGVVAVGGDLRPDRLLVAYSLGIFPWPAEGYPLLWHCPAQRFIVDPGQVRVNRTLGKVLRQHPYTVALDDDFAEVIAACATTARPGQDGTWITNEVTAGYTALHAMGFAHCVAARQNGQLVGGLYGVAIGKAFFGESMFAWAPNASKVAFVTLCRQLQRAGYHFIDAQVHTELLESLGCHHVPRKTFLQLVQEAVRQPTPPGRWRIAEDLANGAAS